MVDTWFAGTYVVLAPGRVMAALLPLLPSRKVRLSGSGASAMRLYVMALCSVGWVMSRPSEYVPTTATSTRAGEGNHRIPLDPPVASATTLC